MGTSGSVRSGRLSGQSARAILRGEVPYSVDPETRERRIPDTIRVFANNQDRVSQFRIEFGSAPRAEREAFLRAMSRAGNINDKNSESSYLTALRDAQNATNPDGSKMFTDAEAREIAELSRSNTAFNAIQNALNKDRDSGNPQFPNISVTRPNRRRK